MTPIDPTTDHGAGIRALRGVRSLLAEAYADDPLMTWIFPDEAGRPAAIAAWLGLFAETYLDGGEVDGIGDPDIEAVACWRWPDRALSSSAHPSVSGLLAALVGAEHAQAVGRGLAATRTVTPAGPHLYLHFLAVRPDLQGHGHGRRLMERGLARASDAGIAVHLETTNEAAVGFYQALGLQVTAELDLPGGGPHLWALGRTA